MIVIKKLFVAFLSVIVLLAFQIAYASEFYKLVGFEDAKSGVNWNNNKFFKRFGQMFSIDLSLSCYDNIDTYKNYINSLDNSDTLPDLFFKANLNNSTCAQLYNRGIIIDLKDKIKNYMPNLSLLLDKYPEIREAISIDNKILSLPYINLTPTQNYIWINKTWIDELNLSMPNNIDEFIALLKSFKSNDPNHNGHEDEIPLICNGIWDLKFLAHAYGINADDFGLYVKDSNIEYAYNNNATYNFISTLQQMYSNGLISKNTFYPEVITNQSKLKIPKYGVIIAPTPLSFGNAEFSKDYVIMPPLEYNGKRKYRSIIPKAIPGTLAISSDCKNKKSILSAFDYLYTEEGSKLITVGLQGEEYREYDDGTWDWIDTSSEAMSNLLSNVTLSGGTFAPYIEPNNFHIKFSNQSTKNMLKLMTDFDKYLYRPMPYTMLSDNEAKTVYNLYSKIGKYSDETLTQFILSEKTLNNDTWNQYKTHLNYLGLNNFIEFWQNKYMEKN